MRYLLLILIVFTGCVKDTSLTRTPGQSIAENVGTTDYRCYVVETRVGPVTTYQYYTDTDVLLSVNGAYNTSGSQYDLDGSGFVDASDILAAIGGFGVDYEIPYSLDDVIIEFDFNEGQSMCSIDIDPNVAVAWFQRTPADELPNTPTDFDYTPKTFKLEVATSEAITTYWMKLQ